MNEQTYNLKCKPVTFNIQKNYKGFAGQNLARMMKGEEDKEVITEHEYFELPEKETIVRPPNIRDVGIPMSNKMSCTLKPEERRLYEALNNNAKIFTPETVTGYLNKLG